MSYSEFPHTNYYDTDLRELIELYKSLVDKYDDTVKSVTIVNERLNHYMAEMPKYVSLQVANAIKEYNTELKNYSSKLENEIDVLRKLINLKVSQLEEADDTLENKIYDFRAELVKIEGVYNRKLSEMRLMILANDAANRKYVDNAIKEMQKKVDNIPKSELPVFDPVKVASASINDAIDSLYNVAINRHGFTALDWHKATHITAQYFHDSDISAMTFWTHGITELNAHDLMFSPVSGKWTTTKMAIYELADYLKVGNFSHLTAEEFNQLNLKAKDYDAKNITAEKYDWHGKEI